MRIFATVMLQDSLKYISPNTAQQENLQQFTTTKGPLKPLLPDSIQQGIPPYADPHSTPSDSIFAKIELNQFFLTYNASPSANLFRGKALHLRPSIFTSSELKRDNIKPALINNSEYSWLTGILVLSFIIYTITQFLYPKRIKQIFNASFGRRYINQLIREGGLFEERITIGLLFIFFTTTSTIIFQGIRFVLNIELGYPALTYFGIFAGLFLFWLLKVSAIKFIGFVFRNQSAAFEYNLTSLVYLQVIGLLLLPLTLPAIFQEPHLFAIVGLILILAGLLINLIRGFLVGITHTKFSLFYLILYLCTLEILPLVIVVKIFTKH